MAEKGSASTSSDSGNTNTIDLNKQIRRHEVAVAELSTLSSSRGIYQKNGNLFFRTTVEKATAFEQKQLDEARAMLQS